MGQVWAFKEFPSRVSLNSASWPGILRRSPTSASPVLGLKVGDTMLSYIVLQPLDPQLCLLLNSCWKCMLSHFCDGNYKVFVTLSLDSKLKLLAWLSSVFHGLLSHGPSLDFRLYLALLFWLMFLR